MIDDDEKEPHYVGEENTLFYIDCGIDVSQASESKVFLRRPDGTTVEKIATPTNYNNSPSWIFFRLNTDDFNQPGTYTGQAHMIIGSWSGWGSTFSIIVETPISSSSRSSSSSSRSFSLSSSSSSGA